MTLAKVNEYVEKRIAEIKNVQKLSFTKAKYDNIQLIIDELEAVHNLTSQIQSLTSQEPKIEKPTPSDVKKGQYDA